MQVSNNKLLFGLALEALVEKESKQHLQVASVGFNWIIIQLFNLLSEH